MTNTMDTTDTNTSSPSPPLTVTTEPIIRPKRRLTSDTTTDSQSQEESSVSLYAQHVSDVEQAMDKLTKFLVWHTHLIEEGEQGRGLIDQMVEKKEPIAVDCEGVNLGDRHQGKVTLVQISTMTGDVYLFDVQIQPELATELKRVLEDENVVKVMHDCRSDSEGLYHQFKIRLKNVFDTQAAHQVLQKRGGVEKIDKNSGLDTICRLYGGGRGNCYKDQVKGVYKKNQNFWAGRPLTPLMISYAASDVLCLLPGVYQELNGRIGGEEDRGAFEEICGGRVDSVGGEGKKESKRNKNGGGSGGGRRKGHHHHQGQVVVRGEGRGMVRGQGQQGGGGMMHYNFYGYDYVMGGGVDGYNGGYGGGGSGRRY